MGGAASGALSRGPRRVVGAALAAARLSLTRARAGGDQPRPYGPGGSEDFERDGGPEHAHAEEAAAFARGQARVGRRGRGVAGVGEAFGAVAVDRARGADAVCAEQRGQARDGGGEAVGREGRGAEERKLRAARGVGVRGEGEARDGCAGRAGLELETDEGQERLDVARGGGQRDRADVVAVGVELDRDFQARAREGLRLEAADEALERGVRDEEEGLERGEGPLEVHALGEGRRREVGLERARVDAARGRVEVAAGFAEAAGDFALGQLREVADRVEPPAVERRGDLERGGELLERQRREKARLLAFGHDGRRVGQPRRDARRELGRRHAHARGQQCFLRRAQDVAREGPLTFEKERMAIQIQIDDPLPLVLHARRKHLRHFEQRLLRRALALAVASARDELGNEGARLGQRHPGLDARAPRLARRGDDARGAAVALADRDGLVLQLRLAAQARGEGEEGDVEAGDHADDTFQPCIRNSCRRGGACPARATGGTTYGFGGISPGGPRAAPTTPGSRMFVFVS